jgi:hypothetical protein
MVMWDHILKKVRLRKTEKYDNSKAIVPAHYFSSLMMEVERKYLRGSTETFATFEFKNNNFNINLDEYETEGYQTTEVTGEFSKGEILYVALNRELVLPYPEKVHLFIGGSGGYYSYYLGIASVLQENFDLSNVVFSGVSGGTLVNLFLALNMDIKQVFDDWNVPLLNRVSEFKMGALFNWNQTAMEHFKKKIPNDAYDRIKGRYYTFTTEFHFTQKWKCCMLGDWNDNDELGQAILASCQIPVLLGGDIYTVYRDQKFIDGFFSYYPELNEIDAKMPSIKIYANTWRPYKLSWLWCWTSVEWHKKIYQWGRDDAMENLKYFKQFLMPKHT